MITTNELIARIKATKNSDEFDALVAEIGATVEQDWDAETTRLVLSTGTLEWNGPTYTWKPAFSFSVDALLAIDETGCDPESDLMALTTGEHTPESLLAHCRDGADEDRVQGWRDYVDALVAAREARAAQIVAR